ncbi:MAG TPA: O-antigen polysaccharide polymerase Wzy family protein [Trichormus sp. M33_DOE_039]|nr:O-antigen polysaccharide polymerase Wzy family protein [Trichormus sp. M33_DOE_039]
MLMNATKTVKPNTYDLVIIITIQCFLLIALILFRFLYEPFNYQPESLIYPFCCILCGLTIWSFWSWYLLTKSLFNPYTLFLLSAFLFNAGQAMLEIFHLNENGLGNWYLTLDVPSLSSDTLLNTIFLVIIGFGAFHLGALISLATFKVKHPIQSTHTNDRYCYVIGSRLLCISFLPAIVVLKETITYVMSSGYSSLYQQESATSFNAAPQVLADFIIPSSLFLLAGSKHKPQGRLISVSIIILYAIVRFFSGERNQAVMPLIALAWLWHQVIKPIPKTFLISIGSLILFIIFPLVAITRNTVGEDRLSIDFLLEAFSSIDNPFIASISEMGASMLTVAYTLQIVPRDREFQMGADYFYALFTLIPNIFGKLHPSVARGLPNHWLTEQLNPYTAAMGGSYGFSFIAEAYLNFGWIGTPITLGIIGFLYIKLMLWANTSCDHAKMAMLASFISFFLFYARAESAMVVRPLVWYSLIPYIGVCWLNNSELKRLRK